MSLLKKASKFLKTKALPAASKIISKAGAVGGLVSGVIDAATAKPTVKQAISNSPVVNNNQKTQQKSGNMDTTSIMDFVKKNWVYLAGGVVALVAAYFFLFKKKKVTRR